MRRGIGGSPLVCSRPRHRYILAILAGLSLSSPASEAEAQLSPIEIRVIDGTVPDVDASGEPWRSRTGVVQRHDPYVVLLLNDRPILRTHAAVGTLSPRWGTTTVLEGAWPEDELEIVLLLASRAWPDINISVDLGRLALSTTLERVREWFEEDPVVTKARFTVPESVPCDWEEVLVRTDPGAPPVVRFAWRQPCGVLAGR